MPNEQGNWNLAVVGATGLIGTAVVERLAQGSLPLGELFLLGSERSEGDSVEFGRRRMVVHALEGFDFRNVDLALFCVPEPVARQYIPLATGAGCMVIDLSPAYRLEPDVPLVAGAINPQSLAGFANHNLISCPDSSVLHSLSILQALEPLGTPVRFHAVFMRAVSEAGRAGVEELSRQSIALFNLKPIESRVFEQQIAFNVLAQAGQTRDAKRDIEQQLQSELKKILEVPDIGINIAAVQVPVFFAHSASLHIDFEDIFSMERASKSLSKNPRICLLNDAAGKQPSAVTHAADDERVYVGRLRQTPGRETELECWSVADNIRAAANNGVLVAEILVKDYL
jgi:aspartate-semialdehyde dehydrogenase